jgi:hypothetical protein
MGNSCCVRALTRRVSVAGILYGINVDAMQYVIDNKPGASRRHIDHVYAHYSGAMLAATLMFIVYCIASASPGLGRSLCCDNLLTCFRCRARSTAGSV